ncbi:hypothetical protein GY45DRAFT_1310594 [Cubamyces sp. BRFM 1775]|nr:hypothetical protein GY45DRAFT_1310594 [Cubamyces sp. BRFM 1775]
MTLNILVSFSLLALVVTARPIPDAPPSVRKSLEVQNAIQAIFASRTGQRPEFWPHAEDEDVHISLTSSEEQSAFLSRLRDIDAVKAVIPLNVDGNPSEDEKQLYDILKGLKDSASGSSLQDLDGGERPLPEDPATAVDATDADADASQEPSQEEYPSIGLTNFYTSPPLIVIAVSCLAAFLSLLCIGLGLYALNRFQSFMLKSDLAWDILPRLERRVGLDGPDDIHVRTGSAIQQPEKRRLLPANAPLPPPVEFQDEKKDDRLLADDPSTDEEDLDEKFEDAQEHSLLFLDTDLPPQYSPKPELPRIVIEEHADPDLLPLPDIPTASGQSTPFSTPLRNPGQLASPTRSPARRTPQMRELQSSPTPASKPLWSLRAADAPALGLTAPSSPSSAPAQGRTASPAPQLPGALFADDAPELNMVEAPRPRTRTPRQPLDIAFALQLRPGLGLGADSAWIVRFLMTMFGWMTVLIGAGRQESSGTGRRALNY